MKPFDQHLFELEMREPIQRMRREMIERRFQDSTFGVFPVGSSVQEVDKDTSVLREFLEEVDKVCRGVWESDGEPNTPEFVREELRPRIFAALSDGEQIIRRQLGAWSLSNSAPPGVLEYFERKMLDLKDDLSNRYEIEATRLGKQAIKVNKDSRKLPISSKSHDPEVAKRRAIVRSNRDIDASDLCETLDRSSVRLPAKWQEAGFKSWRDAYKEPKYRSRIDVLFAKDRRSD
ncbi:MAG TPA: hypothetical protein VEG64_00330 [Candidatus Sulfotelmatobacter sp.]|nr:hypothetical protein [Candidatus Sulfotelmatobacter sp.]